MTALKPLIDALNECLAANAVTVPTIADQVTTTGLHPIANGAKDGAHAAAWTPARAVTDARAALTCIQTTGCHVDRTRAFPNGTMGGLLRAEVTAAEWTLGALTA